MPKGAEEYVQALMESDGFLLWVRGEADNGYLARLLCGEFNRFAAQECAALQAALTEARKEIEQWQKYGENGEWCEKYDVLEGERDALQQRVEALLTDLHYVVQKYPGPHFDPDCPVCKAALRGGRTG